MTIHQTSLTLCLLRTRAVLWVCALLVCPGCASDAMMASSLPYEWQAREMTNAQTVDLHRLASTSIPQDLISAGDVISVDIGFGRQKTDDLSLKVRVQTNGQIELPHIGSVSVMGLNLIEAEDAIQAAAMTRGVYQHPQVTVEMSRPKMNRITVVGAVNKPGVVELRPGDSDLLQAITGAGGLSKEAGTLVEVRNAGFQSGNSSGSPRPAIAHGMPLGISQMSGESLDMTSPDTTRKAMSVDLASLSSGSAEIPTLTDGMVVSVNKLDLMPVTVNGLVKTPGRFDYPVGKNMTVVEAVSLAKGMSNAAADKIYVIRRRPGTQEPGLIELSYKEAIRHGQENILLQPGDVVSVEQTPATRMMEAFEFAKFTISGRVF
jgi:protein involved in polysaccharide export with SLBB domain